MVQKNEQLAKKWSFEDNCQILRTIFKPRVSSSDVPVIQERDLFIIQTLW